MLGISKDFEFAYLINHGDESSQRNRPSQVGYLLENPDTLFGQYEFFRFFTATSAALSSWYSRLAVVKVGTFCPRRQRTLFLTASGSGAGSRKYPEFTVFWPSKEILTKKMLRGWTQLSRQSELRVKT